MFSLKMAFVLKTSGTKDTVQVNGLALRQAAGTSNAAVAPGHSLLQTLIISFFFFFLSNSKS